MGRRIASFVARQLKGEAAVTDGIHRSRFAKYTVMLEEGPNLRRISAWVDVSATNWPSRRVSDRAIASAGGPGPREIARQHR
jgi:hypothetical protein